MAKKSKGKKLDTIALILVIIGTLNLGLKGVFGLDLIAKVLGSIPVAITILNVLIGISGIMMFKYLKVAAK